LTFHSQLTKQSQFVNSFLCLASRLNTFSWLLAGKSFHHCSSAAENSPSHSHLCAAPPKAGVPPLLLSWLRS